MIGNVLVTGGLGYLGGRAAQLLMKEGAKVRVLTRRAPPYPDWATGVDVCQADMPDGSALAGACAGMDAVLHLAAPNEIVAAADPVAAIDGTTSATVNLLSAASAAGVRRLIYLSTIHVYGAPLVGRIDEDRLPAPRHPYAISHLAAEHFAAAAHRKGSFGVVALRLSNAVGAPADRFIDRWSLIGNDLCRQAVVDRRVVLKTPGLQRRDFIPVRDTVSAMAALLTQDRAWDGDAALTLNLGGGSDISIREFAELVVRRCKALLGFEPALEVPGAAGRQAEPSVDFRCGRIAELGISPTGDVPGAIDETLLFCSKNF